MTTISKLFADARQGVQNISARTDHFVDLDIGGESYHGTLFVGKHMRRRLRIWNCVIIAHYDAGGGSPLGAFIYSFQGADANEALDKVERKVEDYAKMVAGMRP